MIKIFNENEEKIIPKASAYWINPQGQIFKLTDKETHAKFICKNPSKFGLHSKSIKQMYYDNKESFGNEGITSETIIRILIDKGWIRIRYRDNIFFIHLNPKYYNTKRNLKPFLDYIKSEEEFINCYIMILGPKNDLLYNVDKHNINDIEQNVLYEVFKGFKFKIFNESDGFYYEDLEEKLEKQLKEE